MQINYQSLRLFFIPVLCAYNYCTVKFTVYKMLYLMTHLNISVVSFQCLCSSMAYNVSTMLLER